MSTWKELEDQAYQQTLEAHQAEIDLAEELERHLMKAFEVLHGTKTGSAVQELVYLMVVASANPLYAAFDLAIKGYYVQSLSLTRTAFELWLAGAYLVCHPEKARGFKKKTAKWPSPKVMRKSISHYAATAAVPPDMIKHGLSTMYDFLSKFAHPSFLFLSSVFEKEQAVRVGPFYRKNGLIHAMDNAYRTLVLIHALLEEVFPSLQTTEWSNKAGQLATRVNDWAVEVADQATT